MGIRQMISKDLILVNSISKSINSDTKTDNSNEKGFWFNKDFFTARKEVLRKGIRYGETEIDGYIYYENDFGEDCRIKTNIYQKLQAVAEMSISELKQELFGL